MRNDDLDREAAGLDSRFKFGSPEFRAEFH